MKRTYLMMTVATAFVVMLMAPLSFTNDSDGAVADVPTQWCYGDTVTFTYGIQGLDDELDIGWELSVHSDFSVILASGTGSPYTYTASQECNELYVRQTVTYGEAVDTAVMKVVLMHIGNDAYSVAFNADNGNVPTIQYIDRHTTVRSGSAFVEMPAAPAKDGFVFKGWYTSTGELFDPYVPITSSMDLHAQWTEVQSPNGNGNDWMFIALIFFVVLVAGVLCFLVIKRDSRN